MNVLGVERKVGTEVVSGAVNVHDKVELSFSDRSKAPECVMFSSCGNSIIIVINFTYVEQFYINTTIILCTPVKCQEGYQDMKK